jgi:4-amino-4-deoxy-L-arabinose transferase-like glycosyltransferase
VSRRVGAAFAVVGDRSPEARTRRAAVLALTFIAALIVLAHGASAPFQKDAEPQSAEWIASVVRDGNWLVPRDAYGFIDRKPPLYYWLSAMACEVAGGTVDEVTARAVSIVAGAALAVEILAWTAAEVGPAEGWLAFLFILATYGYASRAPLALTDMLLTFFVMSALVILYPIAGGMVSPRRALAAGALIGLGILTKGPVALVLVGLTVFIYLLLHGRNPFRELRRGWPWIAAGVAVTIAACWYVPWLESGVPHVGEIFLQENFGHFLPARLGGTGEASRPVWYIVARLAGGALPLVLLLPAALAGFVRGGFKAEKRAALIYQASLTLAVIVFFSAASAKRDDYILPALPGIAILCAAVFALGPAAFDSPCRWAVRLRDATVAVIAAAMLAGIVAAIVIAHARLALPVKLQSSDADLLALFLGGLREFCPSFVMLESAIGAGVLAAFVALWRRRPLWAGAAVGVLSLVGSVFFNAVLRPELARHRSVKSFAREIAARIDGAPLYVVHDDNFELAFYYGYGVPPLVGKHRAPPPAGRTIYLMAYPAELARVPAPLRDRMTLVMQSDLIGREGPPALYEIAPQSAAGADLNPPGQSAR